MRASPFRLSLLAPAPRIAAAAPRITAAAPRITAAAARIAAAAPRITAAAALITAAAAGITAAAPFRFEFAEGKPPPAYSTDLGYGLEGAPAAPGKPFVFSIAATEGNYRVRVTLGDRRAEAVTTVKAELRRLMLENVRTAPGEQSTRTFIVNVRTARIPAGGEVRLKDREKTSEAWAWDDKLTLEFTGPSPAVASIEMERIDNIPTIYIAGDSTSTDQPREPFNSWGQMLTRFFGPEVAIANHGESGESLRGFIGEKRLEKLMSLIRPGDFLLIQMGHNDHKEKGEGIGAFTSYQADLKRFVRETREHGATPVLITSMHRRTFDGEGRITNSLGDYPEAVRRLASEDNVELIDLHAMSRLFYEALGPEASASAFVPRDGTHHNSYGSYQLAKCIVEAVRRDKLGIARYLLKDLPRFDPAHPDPVGKPYGN